MKFKYLIFLIIAAYTLSAAGAESVIRVKAVGQASSHIRLKSKARAAAFRAAKVEGYKKLAEAAGFSKIFQFGKNKSIEVNTLLRGARVVSRRYISDYKVVVVMEMPLPQPVNSKISRLKGEIKAIEAQISTLNRRLEKLRKMVKVLEENVKKQDNQNDRKNNDA